MIKTAECRCVMKKRRALIINVIRTRHIVGGDGYNVGVVVAAGHLAY
jgi:hypothetical protein